jgi:hypothetical protein
MIRLSDARAHPERGETLIGGGGFAGSYVPRLLGDAGATVVRPESFFLRRDIAELSMLGHPTRPCQGE